MATIYLITNQTNGRRYFGLTRRSLALRWSEHVRSAGKGSDAPLHRAIRKWGIATFTIEPFASTVGADATTAALLERRVIAQESTSGSGGYNATVGGERLHGGSLSPEHRAKIAAGLRGNQNASGAARSHKTREKIRAAMLGRKFAAETLARMSDAQKARVLTPDIIDRMVSGHKGKPLSLERRAKISASLIGNQRRKGIPHSEETKCKIAKSVVASRAKTKLSGPGFVRPAET